MCDGKMVHGLVLSAMLMVLTSVTRADTVVSGSVVNAAGKSIIGASIVVTDNEGLGTKATATINGQSFRVTLSGAPGSVVCAASATGFGAAKAVRVVNNSGTADCGKIKLSAWVDVTASIIRVSDTKTMRLELMLQSRANAPQVGIDDVELSLPIPRIDPSVSCSGADREQQVDISAVMRTSKGIATATAVLNAGTPGSGEAGIDGTMRSSKCEAGELALRVPFTFFVPGNGGTFKYTITFPSELTAFGSVGGGHLNLSSCADCSSVGAAVLHTPGRIEVAKASFKVASTIVRSP